MNDGITNLYDLETALEDAFQCALTDAGLTVVAPRQNAKDFQKQRPRVELMLTLGNAKQSYASATEFTGVPDDLRNLTWGARLELSLIANSVGGSDNPAHRTYRAYIRNVMATMRATVNGVRPDDLEPFETGDRTINSGDRYLPYHQVQNIVEAGTSPTYKPETGVETSKIIFAIDFGIITAALAELTPTQ